MAGSLVAIGIGVVRALLFADWRLSVHVTCVVGVMSPTCVRLRMGEFVLSAGLMCVCVCALLSGSGGPVCYLFSESDMCL